MSGLGPIARLAGACLCLPAAACVTAAQNPQSPTATEQLLRAHAAERAAAGTNLRIPAGARTWISVAAGDETPSGKYAAAAFRAHLAGRGVVLVDDQAHADVLVELRIGAAGIDDVDTILGLPAMTIPAIPGTPLDKTTASPELSLYSRHERTGVVEMSAIARDAHTGRLINAVGPLWAVSRIRRHSVLTGIVWGRETEAPGLGLETRAGHR